MFRIHSENGDLIAYMSFTSKWKFLDGYEGAHYITWCETLRCDYNEASFNELVRSITG